MPRDDGADVQDRRQGQKAAPAHLEQSTEGLAAGTIAHLVTAKGRREPLKEVHMGQCSANRRSDMANWPVAGIIRGEPHCLARHLQCGLDAE